MDIAIAGMGMGGLCLAAFLARDGHNITLYDQMDEPGPVGSGFVLQPTGLIVLDQLGLRQKAEARGQRIERMLGKLCSTEKIVLDVGYRNGDYGIAIIRWALFDILYQEVLHHGVNIEIGKRVRSVETGNAPRIIFKNGEISPKFDLVVDAMGARSPLRQVAGQELQYGALWVNLPWHDNAGFDAQTLEQRYHKASHMIGILPLGKGDRNSVAMTTFFWSIRHRDFDEWKAEGLQNWMEKIASFWPQALPFIETLSDYKDHIVHANYRHHTHMKPTQSGFTRLGDAYHATSPQLGQGANMAFLDALALARSLQQNADRDNALREYMKRRRLHIAYYQLLSYCLTPFYQSDSRILPLLRDYLIAPTLRRRGLVHAMVASMVTGQMLNPIKSAGR
ncbi:FAD-dependent oxidoreductase [Bartonella sp. LJL80]